MMTPLPAAALANLFSNSCTAADMLLTSSFTCPLYCEQASYKGTWLKVRQLFSLFVCCVPLCEYFPLTASPAAVRFQAMCFCYRSTSGHDLLLRLGSISHTSAQTLTNSYSSHTQTHRIFLKYIQLPKNSSILLSKITQPTL